MLMEIPAFWKKVIPNGDADQRAAFSPSFRVRSGLA